jgi:hypothetical protein
LGKSFYSRITGVALNAYNIKLLDSWRKKCTERKNFLPGDDCPSWLEAITRQTLFHGGLETVFQHGKSCSGWRWRSRRA